MGRLMNRKIPKDLTQNVAQRDKEVKNMDEKERDVIKGQMRRFKITVNWNSVKRKKKIIKH